MSARDPRRLRQRFGTWAVVTGASEGIGRAMAGALAEAGINLVLVARRATVLASLARTLQEAHGIETRVIAEDLAMHGACDHVVAATRDLDVGMLVAAAGFGTSGPFVDAALAPELEMVDVNCRAVAALAYQFGGRFVRRRRGALVLMSSLLAFQGVPGASNYAATKAYVQALAEGLHHELGVHGVAVIASAPGPIHSGFAARAGMRMGKALTPDVVARQTLAAVGRRLTVRPGWLSKLLEASLALLPRWGRTRMLAVVMRQMTRHQLPPGDRPPGHAASPKAAPSVTPGSGAGGAGGI